MRITLDLPKELLDEAMKASRIKTKSQVIITALEALIQRTRIAKIKAYKGKIDLAINLDAIRGRNSGLG